MGWYHQLVIYMFLHILIYWMYTCVGSARGMAIIKPPKGTGEITALTQFHTESDLFNKYNTHGSRWQCPSYRPKRRTQATKMNQKVVNMDPQPKIDIFCLKHVADCFLSLWPGAYDVLGHIEKASTETQERCEAIALSLGSKGIGWMVHFFCWFGETCSGEFWWRSSVHRFS